MANNIVSLDSLDIKIADFISEITKLDQSKVLVSFVPKGQKFGSYGENICYVKFYNENDERQIYKQRTSKYDPESETNTITQSTMRTLMLHLVLYGPQSGELAALINESLYTNKGKDFLYSNNLSLIPDRTSFPFKSYEEIGGRWWQREDVKLYFYNSISIEEVVGTISELDITIDRQ